MNGAEILQQMLQQATKATPEAPNAAAAAFAQIMAERFGQRTQSASDNTEGDTPS